MSRTLRGFRLLPVAIAFATAGSPDASGQLPTVEKLTEIGCLDCTGPTQFSEIHDVAVSDSGEIVVADRSAPMLRVFDRGGRMLWTGGRSGGGPGEYRYPMRVAIGPNRSLTVVDMRARRLTRLARDGAVTSTDPILAFPAAASPRGRTGDLALLMDDFRGPFTIERWAATSSKSVAHTTIARTPSPVGRGMIQPSMAAAASGALAIGIDPFTYRIVRLDPNGRPLPDITRDIPLARRSEAEMQELATRLAAGPQIRSTEQSVSKAPASTPLRSSGTDFTMKPFYPLDGLRYDDAGRLWVLTTRGVDQHAVFDIFASTGAFAGSVTVPVRVRTFSLAGPYLATASEDAEGVPRVTLWRVRG